MDGRSSWFVSPGLGLANKYLKKSGKKSEAFSWMFSLEFHLGPITSEQIANFITSLYTRAANAAAKSLQSCPTLCDPIDGSPPGCPVPGILQARTLEWVAISFSNNNPLAFLSDVMLRWSLW